MGTAAPWVRLAGVRLGVAATVVGAADFWEEAAAVAAAVDRGAGMDAAAVAAVAREGDSAARLATGEAEVGWSQRPSIRPTTWWVEALVTGAPLCPRMTSWLKRKMSVSWAAASTGVEGWALMAAGSRLMAR